MLRVWVVSALLMMCASGCATTNYDCTRARPCAPASSWGVREPLQPATTLEEFKDVDLFAEFLKQRRYAEELVAFLDSRTLLNRGAVYAGSVAMIGASSATAGLAAFGASASAAAKALPIGTAFLGALFGVFDSRHQAQIYTTAANELRALTASATAAFLGEADLQRKRGKTLEFQAAIADVISRLRLELNAALPTQTQVLEAARKTQDRIEEQAGIKPRIDAITPMVTSQGANQSVLISGSGFGPNTKVWLDATPVATVAAGTTRLQFTTVSTPTPRAYSVMVRNDYGRETVAANTFVQADFAVTQCRLSPLSDNTNAVLLVEGQGFSSAGGIAIATTPLLAPGSITTTWRAHTQWEIVVPRQTAAVTVSTITVTNPAPAAAVPAQLQVPEAGLTACQPIPAKS